MKKLLIYLLSVIITVYGVSAADIGTETLTKMENSVLGANYSGQKTETRLSRLEEQVYGKRKNGNVSDRLKRLSSDLNADLIGREVEPCVDMGEEIAENTPDSSVDYPIIKEVERTLNITSKPTQSLHSRLVAIEKQIFNRVYDTDDFYTRVERIKGKVCKTDTVADRYDYYDDDEIVLPEYSSDEILENGWDMSKLWPKKPHSYYTPDNSSRISQLEKNFLHNTFPDESPNDRLARLENSVFDTEFYYDNEDERIHRLESAYKGKRSSSKYDSNKFQQRLNTAMQIGAMILMVLACIL
ncbi:MAG: hypothetical protein K6E29_07910 [Cyanobacteria bacterium RUI128]|nr:hypothetical protein [Cyanobacteria bacterium RUI128]